MAGDVLEEDEARSHLADDPGDVRPEVAWVGRSLPAAGNRERLAGVARSDEIHRPTPRVAVEGGKVVPERCIT